MHTSQLASLLGISALAKAHGVMVEPHPYNLGTAPLLQVAPLSAELPFPCQGRTEHAEQRTTLTAGTTQTVRFWIAAVHGGGSCQFSVTYDYPPPADPARWKTIYTIIGDCPAKAAGNLPTIERDKDGRENGPQCGNDSGSECVRQFDIPIPEGTRNSENATFAFTWFNRIGNREMYMNCAPVTIANTPGTCTTGESGRLLNIPNPGKFGRANAEPGPGGNGQCPAAGPAPTLCRGPTGRREHRQPGGHSDERPAVPSGPPGSFVTVTTSARTGASGRPGYGGGPMPSTGSATSGAAPAEASRPSWAAYRLEECPAADGSIYCYENNTFGLCTEGWADPLPLGKDQICANGEITYKFNSSSSA